MTAVDFRAARFLSILVLLNGWLAAACGSTGSRAGSANTNGGGGWSEHSGGTSGGAHGGGTIEGGGMSEGGSLTDGGHVSEGGGPPHVVSPCPRGDAEVGMWQDITPPGSLDFANVNTGSIAFVIDPVDTTNVYLGTHEKGIFKSEDCGATWLHVNTGTNGHLLDLGHIWTLAIDQNRSLYSNAGYTAYDNAGCGQCGFWKSTDEGVDWVNFLGPGSGFEKHAPYGLVEMVVPNPNTANQILVGAHGQCVDQIGVDGSPPWPGLTCFAHSLDGGATWSMLKGDARMGYEAAGHLFVDDKTWLYLQAGPNGLLVTTDAGETWTASGIMDVNYQNGQLYRANDGLYYLPTFHGVAKSSNGVDWSLIPASPGATSLAGDGETLFTSHRNRPDAYQTSTGDYSVWQDYYAPTTPQPINGSWMMRYDLDHSLLYSSNERGGFWRIKTK